MRDFSSEFAQRCLIIRCYLEQRLQILQQLDSALLSEDFRREVTDFTCVRVPMPADWLERPERFYEIWRLRSDNLAKLTSKCFSESERVICHTEADEVKRYRGRILDMISYKTNSMTERSLTVVKEMPAFRQIVHKDVYHRLYEPGYGGTVVREAFVCTVGSDVPYLTRLPFAYTTTSPLLLGNKFPAAAFSRGVHYRRCEVREVRLVRLPPPPRLHDVIEYNLSGGNGGVRKSLSQFEFLDDYTEPEPLEAPESPPASETASFGFVNRVRF